MKKKWKKNNKCEESPKNEGTLEELAINPSTKDAKSTFSRTSLRCSLPITGGYLAHFFPLDRALRARSARVARATRALCARASF